ncbi:MAG: hypothetical protein HY423_10890 [Candidatus Lambdaproteobacteria bacterium]|nr:hypothetical protein [Candidatus Lambdaproteobacteria bacterium]
MSATAAGARRLERTLSLARRVRRCAPAVLLLGAVSACTTAPTPYQPLGEAGGYEEARLQPNVYRVSFRANRATLETRVIDFLFLRAAELTRAAGYTHFAILEDFGRTRVDRVPRAGAGFGLGYGTGGRSSFWSLGFHTGVPTEEESVVVYNLAILVIRLFGAEEAKGRSDAFEAEYLIRSLGPRAHAAPTPAKP